MKTDDKIFLQRPGATPRVLLAGEVKLIGAELITCELDLQDLQLESGAEHVVFYEQDDRFVQQPVRVSAVLVEGEADDRTVASFELLDAPMDAEHRESFRVSALTSTVEARVGVRGKCPVLDVSATGLAVNSTDLYSIGNVVPIVLDYEGQRLAGTAVVQSVERLDEHDYRYGLCCNPDSTGECLRRSLTEVCRSIQQEQLARFAR